MAPMIRALALAGALAASTAIAAPAQAAAISSAVSSDAAHQSDFDASRFDPASTIADWRCRGWRCNRWGHRGWRRDRVDAGDVLIGAAILGGVIAIANSNNRRERERDVVVVDRDRDFRDDNRRYDDRRNTGSSGLDSAVDQCLTRIERDVRVESVDNVERTGRGWLVSGVLFNGSPFECRIGNDGRIEGFDFGGGFAGGDWGAASADAIVPRGDGQWSDQRYADARLAMDGVTQPDAPAPVSASAQPLPAYPGGPLPGEDIPETAPEAIDADIGG